MAPRPIFVISNLTRGSLIAQRARLARGPWERARGLLLSPPLKDGEALILSPCDWIHTLGMAYPIDVLYLDKSQRVVLLSERVPPFRLGPWVRGAKTVVELPAGAIAQTGTQVGDQIEISELQVG